MNEEDNTKPKLIFIYNADSSIFKQIEDYVHKIVRPGTYQCNLCALTYNNFGMNNDWKTFVDNISIDVEFLHKDEFQKLYQVDNPKFPSAYLKKGSKFDLFITQDEMNRLKTSGELEDLVNEKVKSLI